MKIRCDKCHVEFNAYLKEQEKGTRNGVVIRTYMKCPTCGTEYDVCYDDSVSLALKKKVRKLLSLPLAEISKYESHKRQRKIDRTKRDITEEMEKAKQLFYETE